MTLRTITYDTAQYKLVPVEPLDEMLDAANFDDREYTLRNFGDVMTVQQGPHAHWLSMLSEVPDTLPGVVEHSGEPIAYARGNPDGTIQWGERCFSDIPSFDILPNDPDYDPQKPTVSLSLFTHPAPAQPVRHALSDEDIAANMTDNKQIIERDEVLYAFHVECSRPTLEDIGKWISKYPQFADDIRTHAAIARDWDACKEEEFSEASADARDAERYNILRDHVTPRNLAESMHIEWRNLRPDESIESRIDSMCDAIIAARKEGEQT